MLAVGGNAGACHLLLRDCSRQGKWAQTKGEMDGDPPLTSPRDAWLKMQIFSARATSRVSSMGRGKGCIVILP